MARTSGSLPAAQPSGAGGGGPTCPTNEEVITKGRMFEGGGRER